VFYIEKTPLNWQELVSIIYKNSIEQLYKTREEKRKKRKRGRENNTLGSMILLIQLRIKHKKIEITLSQIFRDTLKLERKKWNN
jgi:hypothetical protein